MVPLFSRKNPKVAPSSLPGYVAESLEIFQRVWPLPVTLLAYTPTSENINRPQGGYWDVHGLLMMTEELIVYSCLEVVDTVPWVTPLARLTHKHFYDEEETLWTRCGHPTERGEYLDTQWQIPTRINGPERDPFALRLRNAFFEQFIAHMPKKTPTDEQLWPPNGDLGVGAGWVSAVVARASNGPYPPLSQLLGDHRLESRIPEEARFGAVPDPTHRL